MKEIYSLVGQIIENCQYIEYNLAIIMKCETILASLEEKRHSDFSFEELLTSSDEIMARLNRGTLGEALNNLKALNRLENDEIETLEKVLKIRNYLVHNYFKKHDFTKDDLNKEKKYLENTLETVYTVNSSLACLIEYYEKVIKV